MKIVHELREPAGGNIQTVKLATDPRALQQLAADVAEIAAALQTYDEYRPRKRMREIAERWKASTAETTDSQESAPAPALAGETTPQ